MWDSQDEVSEAGCVKAVGGENVSEAGFGEAQEPAEAELRSPLRGGPRRAVSLFLARSLPLSPLVLPRFRCYSLPTRTSPQRSCRRGGSGVVVGAGVTTVALDSGVMQRTTNLNRHKRGKQRVRTSRVCVRGSLCIGVCRRCWRVNEWAL